jgi:hypothetical protein
MQPTQHCEQKQTQRKHTEQYGSPVFLESIVRHHHSLYGSACADPGNLLIRAYFTTGAISKV